MSKKKYYEQIKAYEELVDNAATGIMFYEEGKIDEASIQLRIQLEKVLAKITSEMFLSRQYGNRRRFAEYSSQRVKLENLIEKVRNREVISEDDYAGTYVAEKLSFVSLIVPAACFGIMILVLGLVCFFL